MRKRVGQNKGERKKKVLYDEAVGGGRRHAVSNINRSVSIKIAMEYSKRCNISAKRKLAENKQLYEKSSLNENLMIPPCLKKLYEWNNSMQMHLKHIPYMNG